jgi:hypothetical protein
VQITFALGSMAEPERQAAYAAGSVTYGTAQTLAFDYLFDSVATSPSALALPGTLGFAIIDEVDQILIDNALNPFILARPGASWTEQLEQNIIRAAAVAQGMVRKQLGLSVATDASAGASGLIQLLRTAVDGVSGDSHAALTRTAVEETYWEMQRFALKHVGFMPESLCAPDARLGLSCTAHV